MTASNEVLWTVIVNVTVSPTFATVGLTVFPTTTVGGRLVRVTVASSVADAGPSSSSAAVAVTVSVCDAPASPVKLLENEQV